jgi:glycosyltransferase involved in cell wall biosynthesis
MRHQKSLDIVSFINREWATYDGRPRYFAMAKYVRVLCIEPPITLLSPFLHYTRFLQFLKGKTGLRQIGHLVYLYSPIALIPFGAFIMFPLPKIFERINKIVISSSIKRILKRLNMEDYVIFVSTPNHQLFINVLCPKLICYEVTDEFLAPSGDSKAVMLRIHRNEKKILQKANIVFVVSKKLLQNKRRINPDTYLIPNGADFEHFNKAMDKNLMIPDDILRIKAPRIGFIGWITIHVDIKLLSFLAKSHSEWSIIIIGNIYGGNKVTKTVDFIESKKITNIHYLGWRDYEKLPSYLKAMDVCLLPYKLDEWMQNSHPNKIYQYLSAGKPIVSTDLSEIRPFKNVIKIVGTYTEFSSAIAEFLKKDRADLINRSLSIARENSMESRAEDKLKIIYRYANAENDDYNEFTKQS